VLGALVAAQLASTVALALSAPHNGWVYYQGSDQIISTVTSQFSASSVRYRPRRLTGGERWR